MEVADRIVVMNKGVIEQIGSPGEVYEQPANDLSTTSSVTPTAWR